MMNFHIFESVSFVNVDERIFSEKTHRIHIESINIYK